jgi:hypothetical protein
MEFLFNIDILAIKLSLPIPLDFHFGKVFKIPEYH